MKVRLDIAMDRVLVDRNMYTNTVIKAQSLECDEFGYLLITPVDLGSVCVTEYSAAGERLNAPYFFIKDGCTWTSDDAELDSFEREISIVSSNGYI